MSKSTSAGKWIVIGLVLAALVGGWFTRKNYLAFTHSTTEAVLILAVNPLPEPPAESSSPNDARDFLIRLLLEEQLAQAKLSLEQNMSHLAETHKGVEDAVSMLEEQQRNFEFAQERYDRLMPLVETGALDLLAASQIESAYISARASLAQAQFYLGQVQSARGKPEQRKKIYLQMTQRIKHLEKLYAQVNGNPNQVKNAPPDEEDPPSDSENKPSAKLQVEAVFQDIPQNAFQEGSKARCSVLVNGKRTPFIAYVDAIKPLQNRSTLLTLSTADTELLKFPPEIRLVPCEVTIDTVSQKPLMEEKTGDP
ncbi:MAG: hypothetical protein ACK5LK_02960 [Chthoniobacterales bacterium]